MCLMKKNKRLLFMNNQQSVLLPDNWNGNCCYLNIQYIKVSETRSSMNCVMMALLL